MNCCDEYGQCNQGRDCPVRQYKSIDKSLAVAMWAFAIVLWIIVIGSTYLMWQVL